MKSRLDRIKDWSTVAAKAGFKLGNMGKELDVSVRTLHRYIQQRFGKLPRKWLAELRVAHALGQLERGQSGKMATVTAKYAHESSLCRSVKRVTGVTIGDHLAQAWMSEKAKESPKEINNVRLS